LCTSGYRIGVYVENRSIIGWLSNARHPTDTKPRYLGFSLLIK